ncbi:MAG: suppressor of fused domain protein [Nannocystaceae bacterium]
MERYLGPIARGWGGYGGSVAAVQVCLFENRPAPEVVTYGTLGLSQHVLAMPREREVRQELLLSVHRRFAGENLPRLLALVAERILEHHRALLRGETLPLQHAIARGSVTSSLYVSSPVVFPEGLATFTGTQPPTVLAWLVPVCPQEVRFVDDHGWNAFEDQLERTDPDLFDLERAEILRPT